MKRSEVNYNDLSPMMQQYMDIKKDYEDVLLFFRLGDFYELFFEDAEVTSRELELTLTGKNAGLKERVPMCGVPHHSAKGYIEKLVNKSYKVALVEQLEDPKNTKGMVKRGVVQVFSKGTIVDLEYLDSKNSNYIGSVSDEINEYLITYADISTGELYSEALIHDKDKLINEIINLNLKEVLITNDFDISLLNILKNNYNINITISDKLLEDKYSNCYRNINDDRVIKGIKHLFYYLSVIELNDLDHMNEVKIVKRDNYLNMDVHTIRNLELFETLRLKERQYSLIWLLDKTKTAMGARTLKNMLMHPLKDIKLINERLDIVEKLNNEFLHRENLRNNLYEVYDLERLCGKVICGSLNARDLLQIKRSLSVLPNIIDIVKSLGFDYEISDHRELYELLEKSIYEEPPITIKEGYLIKTGYNSELDELKELRCGGKEFISTLEQAEREKTGISNLKVGFNKVFGYYIEVSRGQLDKVKDEYGWERRQTLTNAERFITPTLKEKEALVLNAEERIIDLEYNLFMEIKSKVKEAIGELKKTAYILSLLDVYASLSIVSEEYKLIRPNLVSERNVLIKDGFHPVVECVSKFEYVKNDIIMDESINTLLITGPNMSGKSTYMRQFAITIILAQMGSFVPASSATLPIFDSIFTRIGASDDLVGGESTFMVEMLEARNAIVNATANSLILFDELGRGTATFDGLSIAQSILEYVDSNIKCKTMFSTHYHELTSLENNHSTIKNVHVEAVDNDGVITFLHKVCDGAVDKSYGIHVASLAKMPDSVIRRASEILNIYESDKSKKEIVERSEQISFTFENKESEVEKELKNIDIMKITPIDAINILYKLQDKLKK
ncbi:MAG: DNA mismatch repair protein MutS [Bacilli bacterium]|nr:DNA mismatch repair protein MutS [Bacilli bacterium]